MRVGEIDVRGIDLRRTFASHGLASLPPMRVAPDAAWFEVTLPVTGRAPRTVRVIDSNGATARVDCLGRTPARSARADLLDGIAHVLDLGADLAAFYEVAGDDPDLRWVTSGAGRMIRSPTVFEDVVKTICTTNCSWGATRRMISSLVEHLGEAASGAPPSGPLGRAFPTPEAMAGAGERFYEEVMRAGYRARYLLLLARDVAEGRLELERLRPAAPAGLADDEVERILLDLPGVGPYAAAHIMMMLGRYSRIILDSWTRPTYARMAGRRAVSDAAIIERFARYGPYAGLAFWLFVTRDWVADSSPS